MIYDVPSYSPWGEVQNYDQLCPGVYCVSTAGHGGVMVHGSIAREVLSPAARKHCFRNGGYYCFEEDCDAPVAIRELMDKGLYTAPVNDYFKPGEYEAVINSSLQTYRPDYWQAREKTMNKQSEKRKGQER